MRVITDQHEWNQLIAPMLPPSGAFLQSWSWGEFQRAAGRSVERIAAEGFAAQLLKMSLPLGQTYWYAPKGPLGSIDAGTLTAWVRERGAAFVRIEPARPIAGAVPSSELQPSHSFLTDLTQGTDVLLARMHEKTRYNLRLAERKGVEIKLDGNLEDAWPLLKITASRGGFRLHDQPYYAAMLRTLSGTSDVRAFLATAVYQGEVIAANIMVDAFGTRTYLHGASGDRHRNVMSPYLLHWNLMQDAKEKGLRMYDWWGVAPEGAGDDHPWAGITRFKLGFGGQRVVAPGTFDLPVDTLKYKIYSVVRNLRRV